MDSKLCNAKLALPRLATWLIVGQAEFKAHRGLIEAIASALFDQSSNEETRAVSIFSKHIPTSRFGRRHSMMPRHR
jgi:hypothetical protein